MPALSSITPTRRAAVCSAVGAALFLLAAAVTLTLALASDCRSDGWVCLGEAAVTAAVAASAAWGMGWVVLPVLRIRRAWAVQLLVLVVLGGPCWLLMTGLVPFAFPALLVIPVAYGLAALLSDPAVKAPLRAAVGVAALIPYALVPPLQAAEEERTRDSFYGQARVPLLAPDVSERRIVGVSISDDGKEFRYRLRLAAAADVSSGESAPGDVAVVVRPVPLDFAPPGRCPQVPGEKEPPSCTAVTRDTWRVETADRSVTYLVRRGSAIAALAAAPGDAAGSAVPALAVSVAARQQDFFPQP